MTVKELIEFLKTQDQELSVVYSLCSEYMTLDKKDIEEKILQPARPDGWVHDSWSKRELATVKYLVFPGN